MNRCQVKTLVHFVRWMGRYLREIMQLRPIVYGNFREPGNRSLHSGNLIWTNSDSTQRSWIKWRGQNCWLPARWGAYRTSNYIICMRIYLYCAIGSSIEAVQHGCICKKNIRHRSIHRRIAWTMMIMIYSHGVQGARAFFDDLVYTCPVTPRRRRRVAPTTYIESTCTEADGASSIEATVS